jgi:hypothetical protein
MEIKTVYFSPCEGFGTEGRTASIYDASHKHLGDGHGETDSEAVVEALVAAGLDFDKAFDLHFDILKTAALRRS